jgi:hypothetical protein
MNRIPERVVDRVTDVGGWLEDRSFRAIMTVGGAAWAGAITMGAVFGASETPETATERNAATMQCLRYTSTEAPVILRAGLPDGCDNPLIRGITTQRTTVSVLVGNFERVESSEDLPILDTTSRIKAANIESFAGVDSDRFRQGLIGLCVGVVIGGFAGYAFARYKGERWVGAQAESGKPRVI